MRVLNLFLKRAFDIVVSLVAIIILTVIPVLIVVPIVIRLTSTGPALFKQVRIGKDQKPFTMYKFRTMILEQYDENGNEIVFNQGKTWICNIWEEYAEYAEWN